MIDDDLSDTAELELMDTDILEQLPDAAAEPGVASHSTASDEPTNDEAKGPRNKPGFDPYNNS
ncbi:MAG TPA: hypothetical protein VKZ91_00340 [Woeseiaceae bacterium]|nr:hypothetical protein [Woeseiaceae bacterium]